MGNFHALCLILIQLCVPLESLLRKIIPTKPITWNKIGLVVPWNFRGWGRSWRHEMSSAFKCICSCTQISLQEAEPALCPVPWYLFLEWLSHPFQSILGSVVSRRSLCCSAAGGDSPMPCPSPPWLPCRALRAQVTELISTAPHKGKRTFFTLNSDFEMYLPLSQTKVFLSDNVQKIFISNSFVLFHDSLIILLAIKFLQYVEIDMLVDMFHIALVDWVGGLVDLGFFKHIDTSESHKKIHSRKYHYKRKWIFLKWDFLKYIWCFHSMKTYALSLTQNPVFTWI